MERERNHKRERWLQLPPWSLLLRLRGSINQLEGQATASATLATMAPSTPGVPFIKEPFWKSRVARSGCRGAKEIEPRSHIPCLCRGTFTSVRSGKSSEPVIGRADGLSPVPPRPLGYMDLKEVQHNRIGRRILGDTQLSSTRDFALARRPSPKQRI